MPTDTSLGPALNASDFADPQRAQQALRDGEERFRALAEHSTAGIWQITPSGRTLYVNAAMCRLLDVDCPESLVGRNYRDFVTPASNERIQREHAKRPLGIPSTYEVELVSAAGRHRHVLISGAPILSTDPGAPGLACMIATVIDVTERKAVEAMTLGQSRVLELLAQGAALDDVLMALIALVERRHPGMLCSVLLLDQSTQRLRTGAAPGLPPEYNAAVDGIAIGPRAGSCGTAAFLGQRVVIEDTAVDPLWADYRELAARFGLRACWSQPIRSRDGTVLGTFAMYYREPCKPTELELQTIDVAAHLAGIAVERARADEALRRAYDEMESRVRTRTAELTEANERLRNEIVERSRAEEQARRHQEELSHVARISLMGEMAAGLAHELNQPLGAISNFARGSLRRLRSGQPDLAAIGEVLEQIAGQAERAARIIRGLNEMTRKRPPRRDEVQINSVIREAAQFIGTELTDAGVMLELRLADPSPVVSGDAIQLEQVILNLMMNGIDAMRGQTGERRLTIRTDTVGNSDAQVAVSDIGRGVAEGMAARLFEPFFTSKPDGMGMGLSISRSIIQAHGGRLWFKSNQGPGMTFFFILPATAKVTDTASSQLQIL